MPHQCRSEAWSQAVIPSALRFVFAKAVATSGSAALSLARLRAKLLASEGRSGLDLFQLLGTQ